MATINPTVEVKSVEVKSVDFGSGRYSAAMRELFNDLVKLLGLSSDKAEKIAKQFGSDFGAAMRNASVSVSVGKIGKEQQMTLGEAAKVKEVMATNTLRIARAVVWMNDAIKNGVHRGETKWILIPELMDYINRQ